MARSLPSCRRLLASGHSRYQQERRRVTSHLAIRFATTLRRSACMRHRGAHGLEGAWRTRRSLLDQPRGGRQADYANGGRAIVLFRSIDRVRRSSWCARAHSYRSVMG
jgi:hypothetical protein